jgi:hypothetical protein
MPLTDEEQNKVKSLLSSLPSEDQKLIQAWKDISIHQSIKAYAEKNPTYENGGAKLEQLRAGTESKIKQLEINNLVLKKCFEKGINYSTIEALGMSFADSAEIDTKLNLLQKDIKLKEEKDWKDLVLKNSFRPGTGIGRDTENTYGIPADQWNKFDKESQNAIAVEFTKKNRKY